MKDCFLLFLKEGDLRITKNLRAIALIVTASKVYNTLLVNCIGPEVEKILMKNQNSFFLKTK